MKEGLRSGSVAAQLEKGNGPSSRVNGRRRGNEVINSGDLVSEEKGLNSNDQRCPLVISSDLEANGESKENATVPLPVQSVKVECECEEVGKPGQRGRKRGRKSKSECGEGGMGDWKKAESSLECKVEVVGRVLRSKTMAMQAIQTEKNGSGKVVDFEQSESNMVGQSDSGSAHYDKKRVKIEEDESDGSAGGSRKKLKGKRGRPVLVKRKRGRPPKEQGKNVMLERVLDKKEEASGSEKGKRKRKRGRPPKVKGENVVLKRVVVKKKEASGSKRNMRASKFKDIVKWNGPNSHIGRESNRISLTEKNKSHELGIQEYETSSAVRSKGVGAFGFREGKKKGKKAKHKKGESGDRRATEKQLVREQIIDMLMRAGWTIDYRPRRDKEYNDAVYKSPMGRGYWSVTLAYNVLKSHYEDGHCEPGFTFTPLPDSILTKLKRNACKGKRRRLKSEQEYDSGGEMKCCIVKKKSGKNKNAGGKSSNRKMKGKSSLSGQDNLTGTLHKVSSVRNRKLQRTQNTKRFALLARSSKEGLTADIDGYAPYSGKRTLLSWMIDLGTVPLNAKVQYMNRRKTRALLEGWISRDGIRCGCCSEILSISKFEIHAGVKLCEPSQNIILETGISLLQCQLDSWNKQKESERSGFHLVDVGADDPNDDTCGICGDGGDLVCCDGCPSTFHQSCLDIQKFPSGDWHCIYCSCKFCGMFSGNTDRMNYNSALLTCHLCEEKYHHMCTQGEDAILDDASSPSFCGKTCREVFEHLQMLLGVKHELEEGFSWTLVRRTEVGLDISLNGIPQKVECNSKLAVASSIMDECFLPIVDQRSGINLIHNVLYNCGSNFNRLNYSGFFTVILERGEEIISAASIRIHGNKLAEMPFIGTRHIYRRQGMCRRLLNAIEYALRSLNVEKLVIPAISELMQTWTSVFGFKPLEVSSRKEMRNMNMLVFHGTDMLQKPLLKDQLAEESMMPSAVLESHELRKDLDIKHGVANNSDRTCSPGSDFNIPSKGANHAHAILDEPAAVESGSQLNEGSLNDLSDITSETTNFPESANEEKNLAHDNLEGKNRTFICPQASACDARALNAHCGFEEIDEHQTAVDDSIILAPGERTVEPGVSCIGSEATGCEKEVFHSSKEGKETIGCELKNDGGITKQSKDSLENDINPQHLDVDFLHGSGENTACLDFEARNQMSDDAKNDEHNDCQQLQVIGYEHNDSQQLQVIGYTLDADDKVLNTLKAKDEVVVVDQKPGAYPTSTLCCSEILCQSCNSSNDALSHLMPPWTLQKVRDVANDSCAALLVGCDLESSCQGDGLDSHKLEYVSASLDTNCQPSDAATKPNEHHQSIELASGLDKNDIPESETCAFTIPVGMSHQTASKLTGDVVHNPKESLKASETGLSSHDDGFPPDRPQIVIESDSVADHSSSGSGMALLCASGGCKAGGAPEVMIVSNQAS